MMLTGTPLHAHAHTQTEAHKIHAHLCRGHYTQLLALDDVHLHALVLAPTPRLEAGLVAVHGLLPTHTFLLTQLPAATKDQF